MSAIPAWVRQLNIFGTLFMAFAIWGAVCVVLVPVLVAAIVWLAG